MPETRARFLANTIGATSASNDFTLPDGVGDENQVLSSDGAGGTTWANTLSAPTISSVTGKLNEYEDGVSEDGGVLTINGTDFGNDASALSVQISGTTGFSTVAETTTISVTTPGSVITATFTGAETNYNHSSFAAGSTIYVKVTKSGLQTSTYATLATAMTGDPSFQTTSTTASTHTGTLAATSLGSYGGQVAGGGDDSNTKLLLNFDRTGGTDIEDSSNVGGNGHKVTASGNAVIKASPFGDGKSAMFFDGGENLQITDNADLDIGTSSFSIDCWFYLTAVEAGHNYLYDFGNSGGSKRITWAFYNSSSSWYGGSANVSPTAFDITTGEWHHWAVCRDASDSNKYRFFLDGVLKQTVTDSTNYNDLSSWFIGDRYSHDNATNWLHAYVDEFRLVIGEALFTSNFTPSKYRYGTTGATHEVSTASNMKLLIHSNISLDSSDSNHQITHEGNVTYNTTSSRWSNRSAMYFDGSSGTAIRIPQSDDFEFGTGAFTIRGWVKPSSASSSEVIFSVTEWAGSNDANGTALQLRKGSSTWFVDASNGTSWEVEGSGGTPTTSWQHFVVTKASGSAPIKLIIDGTEVISTSNVSGIASASLFNNKDFVIGGYTSPTNLRFTGYISDFEVLKGESTTTSPINSEITKSTNTKLLLLGTTAGLFADSATSGTTHTITPTGSYHSQNHGGIAPALAWPASLKKTGSAGVYFDGGTGSPNTGDYLSFPNSAPYPFDFGTGDFTIDFWMYVQSIANYDGIITFDGPSASADVSLGFKSADNKLYFFSNAGSNTDVVNSGDAIQLNRWYYVAVVKYNGTTTFYLDGTDKTSSTANYPLNTYAQGVKVGRFYCDDDEKYFHGYLDNLRISSTARYTSNFTPPTQIYGAYRSQDVGTIQLNATAGTGGGALDYAELSGGTALSTYGLSLSSSGAITGTLSGLDENSNSGGVIRIRARANADDDRVTTLGGSSFTGITQNDNTAPVLFSARRYHGSGVTGKDLKDYGFNPDFAWIKRRNGSVHGVLVDSVRGAGSALFSSSTQAVSSTPSINFINNGIELDTHGNVNANDGTYIAWAWKAGGAPSGVNKSANGTATEDTLTGHATNTGANIYDSDKIASMSRSVNVAGGFSICKITNGSSASASIGVPHGLGVKPDMVIWKSLAANNWNVWHKDATGNTNLNNAFLLLNTTDAENTAAVPGDGVASDSNYYYTPNNSSWHINAANREWVMYSFVGKAGVSAFGSYTGTGSSAFTAQNLGFQPRWIMFKNISRSATEWPIHDSFRGNAGGGGSGVGARLYAQAAGGESNDASTQTYSPTITSTGFTFPTTVSYDYWNRSGDTYIYMAFA